MSSFCNAKATHIFFSKRYQCFEQLGLGCCIDDKWIVKDTSVLLSEVKDFG